MNKDPHRYDNLIDNRRPITEKPMDRIKRAAQFAPFAALTGYEDQIDETARVTEDEIFLDESEKEIIDRRLQDIFDHIDEPSEIEVTYYVPDAELHRGSAKSGGEYICKKGAVKKIDKYERCIVFTDGLKVGLDYIVKIL